MPTPQIYGQRASMVYPKSIGRGFTDTFDERGGRVPNGWVSTLGTGLTIVNSNLRMNAATENIAIVTSAVVRPGYDFEIEVEIVPRSGAPDMAIKLTLSNANTASTYIFGLGSFSARYVIAKTVSPSNTVLSSVGTTADVAPNVPWRFRMRRIGKALSLFAPAQNGFPVANLAVTDTVYAGPFYVAYDCFASATLVADLRYLRYTILR